MLFSLAQVLCWSLLVAPATPTITTPAVAGVQLPCAHLPTSVSEFHTMTTTGTRDPMAGVTTGGMHARLLLATCSAATWSVLAYTSGTNCVGTPFLQGRVPGSFTQLLYVSTLS